MISVFISQTTGLLGILKLDPKVSVISTYDLVTSDLTFVVRHII